MPDELTKKPFPLANQNAFSLTIDGVLPANYAVLNFQCGGADKPSQFQGANALGEDYQFILKLAGSLPLPLSALLGKTACLNIQAQAVYYYHGIISHIEKVSCNASTHVQISLSSPLNRLKLAVRDRVFACVSLLELIDAVLSPYINARFVYECRLTQAYPRRDYMIQYQQSDYDFLCQHLFHQGMFFTFWQSQTQARLIITDNFDDLCSVRSAYRLSYLPPGEQTDDKEIAHGYKFTQLVIQHQVLTQRSRLKEYNPQMPRADLMTVATNKTALPGVGEQYLYAEGYSTQTEGERLARVRQHALDWQRHRIVLETDCLALAPGSIVQLVDYPLAYYNQHYRVIALEISGTQDDSDASLARTLACRYQLHVTLVPLNCNFAMPVKRTYCQQTYFKATIVGETQQYAAVDEHGCYYVRLSFADDKCGPIRMAQCLTGPDSGIHFPLYPGCEVLLACLYGDINRLVILGALPTHQAASPVTAGNKQQHIIRTKGGQEILVDDNHRQPRIALRTSLHKQQVQLYAGDKPVVQLTSNDGDINAFAGAIYEWQAQHNIIQTAGADTTLHTQGDVTFKTAEKSMYMITGQDMRFVSQAGPVQLSSEMDIQLNSDATLIASQQDSGIQVTEGNLNLQAKNGGFYLHADDGVELTAGKHIMIQHAGATIELDESGGLSITAPVVNLSGLSPALIKKFTRHSTPRT